MRRLILLILIVGLALTACGDESPAENDNADSGGDLGLFDWERNAATIVARLDSLPDQERRADHEQHPPCRGRWPRGLTTRDDSGAEAVLEARIDEVTMRGFLEDIINRGFYAIGKTR